MSMARPVFSVLVPASQGGETAAMDSVRAQSLRDVELLIVGDSEVGAADVRIRRPEIPPGRDGTAALNAALDAALGEFVIVLPPADRLDRLALARLARQLSARPDADVLYSDEDVPDGSGRRILRKPDWSPERFRCGDYLGGARALRTALVREVGGYRADVAGAHDYDLTLRVTERARHVAHVPAVLYHRATSAPVTGECARRVVQDQLDRLGITASVQPGAMDGYHRIVRRPDPSTPVSVIVPTRGTSGEVDGVQRCFVVEAVRSALAKTALPNVEIVLVHDAETPESVLAELREVAADRLVLVPYDQPFNFAAKCNLGALRASGDVLVLLNDDMEVISEHWLEMLVAPLAEPDVGMTGAKLLFPDGVVQHAGHLHGVTRRGLPNPRNAYRGGPGDAVGEFGSLVVNREASGVTAACAAVRRADYEQVGGLSEQLPVNYNDVDLCLKLRHLGRRILWLADCRLYHFESRSRDRQVHDWEREFLARRWGTIPHDPYLPWLGR